MYGRPDLDRLPDPMRGLVTRCLVKDPEERPSPEQVLTALSTLLDAVYGEDELTDGIGDLIDVQERTLIEVAAEQPTLVEPPEQA